MNLICAWCGRQFSAPVRPGPRPRYCSHSHRQRAYEVRRRSAAGTPEPAHTQPRIGRHGVCMRVLGPLEALRSDGSPIPLGPVVRRLLASLALRPRQTISAEKLIDDIWLHLDDAVARHRLHVAVSKLRQLLAAEGTGRPGAELIQWSDPGYVLDAADEQLDWVRFRRLRQAGERAMRAGTPELARTYLAAALSLWVGPEPLAGLDISLGDTGLVASLEAEHERADRLLIEARSQLGETDSLIPELEARVAAEPFDTDVVRQLALAHHRAGRSDRALAVCREHLERVAAQSRSITVGVIAELQRAILRRDPSLGATAASSRPQRDAAVGPVFLRARWEPYLPSPSGPLPAELALLVEANEGVVREATATWLEAGFEVARSATRAAIALQWACGEEPLVRVGIAAAAVRHPQPGFEGPSLARARLLASAAWPGQILVTVGEDEQPTPKMVPVDAELHPLGSHRLSPVIAAAPVFRVTAEGIPSVVDEPRWLERPSVHHLAPDPYPLVGREPEVARTVERLIGGRIVTLSGAPGSGKTRLASHVAEGMSWEFRDGAWFVGLQTVTEPALVAAVVADALQVPRGAVPAEDATVRYLSRRHLLLVLDNCEHLAAEVGALAERVVAHCPDVRVLATSRRPLGVASEAVLVVEPLEPPPPFAGRDSVGANPAVRLLLDRLGRSAEQAPNTELDAAARIARAVDGVPLALVLAAARAHDLGLGALADVLDGSLEQWDVLGPLAGTDDGQAGALASTLEWSYRLLEDDERELLDALSVFSASFAVEDALVVCADEGASHAEVADVLTNLADASLLATTVGAAGAPARHHLLQPINDFARANLAARGDETAATIRRRHAQHFVRKLEEAEPDIRGRQDVDVLDEIESGLPDLYAAIRWALEAGEATTALRLVGYLWGFWLVRGRIGEGRHLIEAALAVDSSMSHERAKALIAVSQMAWYEGDMARVRAACHQALEIGEALEDQWTLAWASLGIAAADMLKGEDDGVPQRIEQLVPLFRELGNDWDTGQALQTLGGAAWHRGQYERAEQALREARDLYRSLGHPTLMASLLAHGIVLALLGDLDTAVAQIEEGMAAVHEAGDLVLLSHALGHRATVARYAGEHDLARQYYREAIAVGAEVGNGWGILWAMAGLAATDELGLHVETERLTASVKLLARVEATSAEIGISLAPRELESIARDLQRARERVGEEAFRAAYAEGESMDMPEAVELALGLD